MTKKKLRFCHLADVHLGYRRYNKLTEDGFNQREVDVSQAFRETIDRIITLKPDLVLVAGDLFHSIRPSNAIITFAFRQFKKLAEKTSAPIILLAGNHDTPKRSDSGSLLRLFQEIEGIYVADEQIQNFIFADLKTQVTCLPHAVLQQKDPWKISANDKCDYNILLTHAQVGSDYYSDFGGVDLNFKQFVPGEWDYIALGHVHVFQEVMNNAVYPGAIEHTSKNIWHEADFNKGFIEVMLPENKRTFYSLTTPREVMALPAIDADSLDPDGVMESLKQSINAVAGGISGKILKLEVMNIRRSTYEMLDHREIRKWRSEALSLTIDYKSPPEKVVVQVGEQKKQMGLEQELKTFCEEKASKALPAEQIADKLIAYLKQLEVTNEVTQH